MFKASHAVLLSLSLLCLLAAGLVRAADVTPAYDAKAWPTLHRDNQRSGYTKEVLSGPFEIKWYHILAEEVISCYAEVIVGDGKAYIPTYAGKLHAYDIVTGEQAWDIQAGGPIGNSACYVDGKVLFGSDDAYNKGTLWCVKASDGSVVWTHETPGGIWNHPVTDGKTVYVGDRSGVFSAVDLATGAEKWTVKTDGMVLTPASITPDGQRIVFGSEDMHVRCVDPAGKVLWTSETIEGTTMRHYAPTIWNEKVVVRTNPSTGFHEALSAIPMKEAHETYTRETVMTADERQQYDALRKELEEARPNLYRGSEDDKKKAREDFDALKKKINDLRGQALDRVGDKIWFDDWGQFKMRPTEHRYDLEMETVRKRITDHPSQQTLHVLNLADGQAPYLPLVLYQSGKSGPGTPLTFNPETGDGYVWGSGTLSNYMGGVPGNTGAVLKLDPETGKPEFINHRDSGWDNYGHRSAFGQPADETMALTLMGDNLINTHMGTISVLNLDSRKNTHIINGRDTYGGLFGPKYMQGFQGGAARAHFDQQLVLMMNAWHGPGAGAVSIADNRVFFADSGAIVCLGGPDVPKSDKHADIPDGHKFMREEMPVWPAGNWAFAPQPSYDDSVNRIEISSDDIATIIDAAPPATPSQASSPAAQAARTLLDAEVTELVEGGPWRAFHYQMGFTGLQTQFDRSATTVQVLAEALPHLSPAVRTQAVAYLDKLWGAGWPMDKPLGNVRADSGKPREFYRLHDEEINGHIGHTQMEKNAQFTIEDFPAVWAYAHYADRWEKVTDPAVFNKLTQVFGRAASKPMQFPFRNVRGKQDRDRWNDGADRLNAWLAGAIAYARIAEKAGKPDLAAKGRELAAKLAADRVHVERADKALVIGQGHAAKVARYRNLSPDVMAVLAKWAPEELAFNNTKLRAQCPWWHHANAELAMGGENWTQSPQMGTGLFLSWADGLQPPAEELLTKVDHPNCHADLYYIQKLAAVLRRCEK